MSMRQEQIVFVVALGILALLSWRIMGDETSARRGGGAEEDAELVRFAAPDLAQALPRERGHRPLVRDLLSPPSDTRPLPPLGLVEPPRAPLAALFPPPEPGPSPAAFGGLLRHELEVELDLASLADLFAEMDSGLGGVEYDLDDFELFADPNAVEDAPSLLAALDDAVSAAVEADLFESLTPQEVEQVILGWKQQYDWYDDQVRLTFGRIENKDRYGLKIDPSRVSEPLLFVEVDPATGTQRFGSMEAIAIGRDRAVDWDFAATFANQIEVGRRELGEAVTRSTYNTAMTLAEECVRRRLDAVRSLEIAGELYSMCAAFDPADPAPRLGSARCFEAGFEFEQAFRAYNELLGQFDHRAEVHARLGALEARFLLFEQAEQRLANAVRIDRGSWEARRAFGRFLSDRGRHAEAVEHLRHANKAVPNDPQTLMERVGIRVDLASAEFALGNVKEAHALFSRALATDPENQLARAGTIATEILLPGGFGEIAGDQERPSALGSGEPGIELLLARGLAAAATGDLYAAKGQLYAAADADPLRANLAWRALSFVAEQAGQVGEAQRFIEMALECDPTDAWALYQAGRLRALDEDVTGAREAFLQALDQDLDFVDALTALGEMAYRMGDFADAERFLERAVALEGDRVAVHALRGLNYFLLESTPDARACFQAGRNIVADDVVCRAGMAWCTYLEGDSEQALVQLRELDDSLRDRPKIDPMRIWATASIQRIQDHEQKVQWSDVFDRKQIRNDWDYREDVGPVHGIVDGSVTLEGSFNATGATALYRTMAATLFVAVEADVWIEPTTKANVGLFIARERERRTTRETLSRVAVLRHRDGSMQVNVIKEGQSPTFIDMEYPFPTGQWVRLRIERKGDSADTRVTLYADGVPLIENVPMSTLRAATPILVGFMAEGASGHTVDVKLDNFKVVYRE